MGHFKQITKYLKILHTRGFWIGLGAGILYFSYIFWWFWSTYPLTPLGFQNKFFAFAIILMIFTACVAITSIWWGVAGFAAGKFIDKKLSSTLFPLAVAGTLTLTEYFRSIFFSIFWFGSGGAIGPHWPLGNVAYLLINLKPLAQTASLWGIYGIDFVVVLIVAAGIFVTVQKNHKKFLILQIITAVLVIGAFNFYPGKSSEQNPIPVALIQTHTPSDGFSDPDQALRDLRLKLQLLEKAAETIQKGIIVFPEGTNLTKTLSQFLNNNDLVKYFYTIYPQELLIIDNLRVPEEDNFHSKAVFISSKDGVVGSYDKQILTPGGEFLPYIVKWPLSIISPNLRKRFRTYREYDRGYGSNIVKYQNNEIKILICSDMVSPQKSRDNNGDFTIIMTSLSIWNGSKLINSEALPILRYRAIESGKHTVLASNFGRSYIINRYGEVEKMTQSEDYELLTGTIIPNQDRTWYNYVGDWPILLLSGFFFILGMRKKVHSN